MGDGEGGADPVHGALAQRPVYGHRHLFAALDVGRVDGAAGAADHGGDALAWLDLDLAVQLGEIAGGEAQVHVGVGGNVHGGALGVVAQECGEEREVAVVAVNLAVEQQQCAAAGHKGLERGDLGGAGAQALLRPVGALVEESVGWKGGKGEGEGERRRRGRVWRGQCAGKGWTSLMSHQRQTSWAALYKVLGDPAFGCCHQQQLHPFQPPPPPQTQAAAMCAP